MTANDGSPIQGDLGAYIDGFMSYCSLRGMSPGTIEGYRSNMRIWKRFVDEKGIVPGTGRKHLEAFLGFLRNERKYSPATVKGYFAALSTFYKYLIYEDVVDKNPVLIVREHFLRTYKKNGASNGDVPRKVPTTDELAAMVRSILDARDRAIVMLFAKTGVRRQELINMDASDINWEEGSITLKDTFAKRTNHVVFFDEECARTLRGWIRVRERYYSGIPALFIGARGGRLKRRGVFDAVAKHAEKAGLHDPTSKSKEDHFGPHSLRYWFTHTLLQAGMRREMVQELRGDVRREAVDIYDRIPREELRSAYLTFMPELGI